MGAGGLGGWKLRVRELWGSEVAGFRSGGGVIGCGGLRVWELGRPVGNGNGGDHSSSRVFVPLKF